MRKSVLKLLTRMTLDKLARVGIFTIDDAVKVTGLKKSKIKHLLPWLEKMGWIERIEKGKYIVIPLGVEKGKITINEFVLASMLVKPSAIAYWSALNYHGLTEQISNTVFIQTTSRKKKQELEILGIKYKIIRINKRKFFGIEKIWIDSSFGLTFQVNITDKEKTIIDCLDKPKHCGGIIEVAKALNYGNLNMERLARYAVKIRNSGVIRRLGYLCDYLGLEIDLPEIKARNYLLLDPTMPKVGKINSKWRLIINVDIGELE